MSRRKPKKPKYPVVHVEWKDATSFDGWRKPRKINDLARIHTTGYLLRQTKEKITICGSVADDGAVGDCITIPKPWLAQKMKRKKKRD